MLAEVMILLPSIARFRQDFLQERLDRSQLASLVLLASPDDMLEPELERELLANAGVLNIILRRTAIRELVLAEPMPMEGEVEAYYDLRNAGPIELMQDAFWALWRTDNRLIRVMGLPDKGLGIEVTLHERPLREKMVDYAVRILWLSVFISVITAALLIFAVRGLIVKPIRNVVTSMIAYQDAPEDAHRIITPQAGVRELRAAETALQDLQSQLTRNLKQKDRLASLGEAVSKISHDLRNMLTTVQLLADRMEQSADPTAQRIAPKLIGSVNRAISLCEQTLEFGKAEEAAPRMQSFRLETIVRDILDAEQLREDASDVDIHVEVPEAFCVTADPEQMFRAINNLIRNSRQAIAASGKPGTITVRALATEAGPQIEISDTGPGLPAKARANLFTAFQGGTRRGGSGLGLAIASELVRGHGGTLELVDTSDFGTRFRIRLPDVEIPVK